MEFYQLKNYIPEEGISLVKQWLEPYNYRLIFKNPRRTKMGDYRRPIGNSLHQITINAGMEAFMSFFVLTHEIAHLINFEQNRNKRVLPHGKEWKKIFSNLIIDSIFVYEEESREMLINFSKNPKAAFHSDLRLSSYFTKKQNPTINLLSDLEENEYFKWNDKVYKRLNKRRTRYICKEVSTHNKYLISGTVAIKKIRDEEK